MLSREEKKRRADEGLDGRFYGSRVRSGRYTEVDALTRRLRLRQERILRLEKERPELVEVVIEEEETKEELEKMDEEVLVSACAFLQSRERGGGGGGGGGEGRAHFRLSSSFVFVRSHSPSPSYPRTTNTPPNTPSKPSSLSSSDFPPLRTTLSLLPPRPHHVILRRIGREEGSSRSFLGRI